MNMPTLPTSESEKIEFKTSFNEGVIETLVAFSNTKGGTVYIGITDTAEVKGISLGKETTAQWINEIKNKTAPQIIPDIEVLTIDDKTLVSFNITEYPIKPVSTRGRYYKRVGNSNHLLSVSEVANMHLQTVNSSWDYYPRQGKTLKDISLGKVQKVMDTIKYRNSNFEINTSEEFLNKNELLLEGDQISNGCYLMFCKDDNLYSTIHMGHFASEIVIKDDVSNSDDILNQIEDVMSFVRKHINKEIIISNKQIENIQRWQYPLDGIREIVLNMIIHRDYSSSVDSLVKVFPDRILFFNPGSLPDSITIEKLLANTYVSTPRNRQIAKMTKEMGLIEKYGTGIKRVLNIFTEYGLQQPIFELIPGGFAVTVFSENSKISLVNKFGENVTENVTENRSNLIVNTIRLNNIVSIDQLSEILKVSKRTIIRDIEKLKKQNIIARVGPVKGGHWEILPHQ